MAVGDGGQVYPSDCSTRLFLYVARNQRDNLRLESEAASGGDHLVPRGDRSNYFGHTMGSYSSGQWLWRLAGRTADTFVVNFCRVCSLDGIHRTISFLNGDLLQGEKVA